MKHKEAFILGAGITGLAAGCATGLPIFEAQSYPGGKCASYYMRPGKTERFFSNPGDQESYRFEISGGHWVFGTDTKTRAFINSHATDDSLVIASPTLVWLLQPNAVDPQLAIAATGQPTPGLPGDIPVDRFAFAPFYTQAQYIVDDNLGRATR